MKNSRTLLGLRIGLSITGVFPLIFQILSRTADIAQILTAVDTYISAGLLLAIIGFNIVLQGHLNSDNLKIDPKKLPTEARPGFYRERSRQRTLQVWLRNALVVLWIAAIGLAAFFGNQYFTLRAANEEFIAATKAKGLALPPLPLGSDEVIYHEAFNGKYLLQLPPGVAEVEELVFDQEDPDNRAYYLKTKNGHIFLGIIGEFKFDVKRTYINLYRIKYISMTPIEDIYPKQVIDALSDGKWHTITEIFVGPKLVEGYIDGKVIKPRWKSVAQAGLMKIPVLNNSIVLLDDIYIWSTQRSPEQIQNP